MSIFFNSILNSSQAGKRFEIVDIRNFITDSTNGYTEIVKKIYGKTYRFQGFTLRNMKYNAAGYNAFIQKTQENLIDDISTSVNDVDSVALRLTIKNIYLVYTIMRESTYHFHFGFSNKNEKEQYDFVPDSVFFSGSGVATYPQLPFLTPIGFIDGDGVLWFTFFISDGTTFPSTLTLYNLSNLGAVDYTEFNDEYGNYSTSGGYGGGSFDDSSDAFGLPTLPSLGVSEVGFVNVYNPTKNELLGFADELFPDFEKPTPSQKEGLDGVVENLANVTSVIEFLTDSYINKGLIDFVIDCHIIPVTPSTTSSTGLKVGFKTFNYNPKKVVRDYVEFDCGSLSIPEYYQNFLDYYGTRAKLYCPFIGFVDVKPEWFQSGVLQLIYHFNVIDGSCIAFLIGTSSKSKLKNTVVATFGGNCCVHMPITGLNYSSMITGIVSGGAAITGAAINKDLGGMARGVTDVLSAKPSLEQSNGYNAGMSYMCYRRPYLLIERPVASFSKNYPHEQGLPLNATQKLSNLSGMTICENVVLDNFPCLSEEKEMIQAALAEGIIL